jgi:DNA-directed RNA polymerase specialized sigma24 family protein
MPLVDQQYIDHVLSERSAPPPSPARGDGPNRSLLDRARFLLPPEKLLVELAFKNHLSHRQIAQILSIPAGTVTRRLQRICRRLRDPMILALLEDTCELPTETRALALAHFLHRRSAAQLAREHSRSEGEILRLLEYVRGWYRGITSARQRAVS